MQRAKAAGFEALVLTVDAPVHGARDRERRAGFRLPHGVSAVNLTSAAPAVARRLAPGQRALFDDLLTNAPTWADVEWLRSTTRLPLLLKGVLREADARQAALLGVAGLIVSNHGGRTCRAARPAPCARTCSGRRAGCGAHDPAAARRVRERAGAHRLRHSGRVVARRARAARGLKQRASARVFTSSICARACRALMCSHDKSRLLLERKRVLPMKNASQCCIQALPFAPRGVLEK